MAIVRLDKIAGTHLANGRHATVDLRNGYFVQLNGLIAGEGELYDISALTALENEALLHATPEVMYDPRQSALEDFVVESGEEARLYHLEVGDIITLTDDLFDTATIAVGDTVRGLVGSFLLTNAVPPTGVEPRFTAEVIEATTLGFNGQPAYAIRVVTV